MAKVIFDDGSVIKLTDEQEQNLRHGISKKPHIIRVGHLGICVCIDTKSIILFSGSEKALDNWKGGYEDSHEQSESFYAHEYRYASWPYCVDAIKFIIAALHKAVDEIEGKRNGVKNE